MSSLLSLLSSFSLEVEKDKNVNEQFSSKTNLELGSHMSADYFITSSGSLENNNFSLNCLWNGKSKVGFEKTTTKTSHT